MKTAEELFFSKGLAVGGGDILNEVWYFRFREKRYKVPSFYAINMIHYMHRHPTIMADKLDKWMI